MDTLSIAGTNNTPEVCFDIKKSVLQISGISIHVEPINFYKTVLEWIDTNKDSLNSNFLCEFRFDCLSVSSYRIIVEIISTLRRTIKNLNIIWNYHKEDEYMQEMGCFINDLYDIPVKLIAYN